MLPVEGDGLEPSELEATFRENLSDCGRTVSDAVEYTGVCAAVHRALDLERHLIDDLASKSPAGASPAGASPSIASACLPHVPVPSSARDLMPLVVQEMIHRVPILRSLMCTQTELALNRGEDVVDIVCVQLLANVIGRTIRLVTDQATEPVVIFDPLTADGRRHATLTPPIILGWRQDFAFIPTRPAPDTRIEATIGAPYLPARSEGEERKEGDVNHDDADQHMHSVGEQPMMIDE